MKHPPSETPPPASHSRPLRDFCRTLQASSLHRTRIVHSDSSTVELISLEIAKSPAQSIARTYTEPIQYYYMSQAGGERPSSRNSVFEPVQLPPFPCSPYISERRCKCHAPSPRLAFHKGNKSRVPFPPSFHRLLRSIPKVQVENKNNVKGGFVKSNTSQNVKVKSSCRARSDARPYLSM